jgi:hypothetical protein
MEAREDSSDLILLFILELIKSTPFLVPNLSLFSREPIKFFWALNYRPVFGLFDKPLTSRHKANFPNKNTLMKT